MTTRKTTTGYKVTVDFEDWCETFDFYEDVKVCFKPLSREYRLDHVTTNFELCDVEIDYLLGKATKEDLEDFTDEHIDELDRYKKDYTVVWLSFNEHSLISIWYGDDGVMLVEKDATPEFIHELVKELDSWMNWRIYRVDVYEATHYINENNGERDLIHWEYVDGQGWYFKLEDALDSLPDYAGEIIEDSESEHFEEFEWC